MNRKITVLWTLAIFALVVVFLLGAGPGPCFAQDETEKQQEEPFDEGLFPEPPMPGEEVAGPAREGEQPYPVPPAQAPEAVTGEPRETPEAEPLTEPIEGGEAREGEASWNVNITTAVVMNYTFSDTSKGFTVKYRLEVKGQANAETAVIHGDADIKAEVTEPLSKWPTGECRLEITIPKVPFELTFRKTGDEKGNLKLIFKKALNEDWQSKCTFTDTPGAKFDTRGTPETWLTKALDKARPPLRDIVANMGNEETTTSFVISKETIPDPPIGNCDIEGTGVITIKPGGE